MGHWTAIRLQQAGPEQGFANIHSVQTEDGDGVSVEYVQANQQKTSEAAARSPWAYAIPGSQEAPLIVETSEDSPANARIVTRFPADTASSNADSTREVPLSMPWIVSLGEPLGVDAIGANALLRRSASVAVSNITSADQLPDRSIGYDGVDLVMIGGSGLETLGRMNANQQHAIQQWIVGGGRVFLMLGESLPQMQSAAPWLVDLIPTPDGRASETLMNVQMDPSAIETFTSTQTLLTPYAGVNLPKGAGETIVIGRTNRRVSTPVAAEYVVGFGKLTVLAADLDRAPFADWPQRLEFIMQLTKDLVEPDEPALGSKNRGTAFDDLAGQMRATLDRFPNQRRFSFSVVSLIVLSLIALVGPLDYLLINRLFGKPLLGWLTFPLIAIGMSAFLVLQARPIAGSSDKDRMPINRVEFVDIDSQSQQGESLAWSVLYSHDARRLNLSSVPGESLDQLSTNVSSILTSPFGFPGRSFGSIQVTGENARLPTYQVEFNAEDSSTLGSPERGLNSNMIAMPLAPRSSKSIASRTKFQPNVSNELVMYRRGGSELLQGELVNPLGVDLLNGMLVYRNWAYLLPTRFPAGGRIESIESLRQKNFRRQLSRQRALESSTETQLWDATMFDDPGRVAEMMMFHDVVGADRYTTLRSEVLSSLDFSSLLTGERCLLIGRLAQPFTQLQSLEPNPEAKADPVTELEAQNLTLLRLVIPVEHKRFSY
ncbi:hypothetical protein [Novipirellula aureliae]|uniref:hypothetical protein n=1 Tax=Novipirellula aureliae TaxID=2527966 RepID=UPI0011B5E466|nr:hypothetical protein [Novipirellula aureliae]